MKRLILLSSCSHDHPHEHPLADHGHEHTHDHSHDLEHEHYSAFNLGLPYAYIIRVDPPPTCTSLARHHSDRYQGAVERHHSQSHNNHPLPASTEVDFVYKCPEED